MREGSRFAAITAVVVRRPLVPIAVVAVLAAAGALLALRLDPVAGTETLVAADSDTAKANERFTKQFGDDAVVVLVEGDLQRTMLTPDNRKLVRLEACLSGDAPRQVLGSPLPGVCDELRELRPAKVVFGPGTFLNTSVEQINVQVDGRLRANQLEGERAARAARALSERRGDTPAEQARLGENARQAVNEQFAQELLQLALRYQITPPISIDNPEFVDRLVFQGGGGEVGVPKARFAYLFPSSNAALITMRLRSDLTESQRSRTIDLVEQVTSEPTFALDQGGEYVVSGVPAVIEGLADEVASGIFYLLGAALLLMAATLALVFRTRLRLRLLPLALALAAAAMTFGVLSLTGGGLTMATIAVLPVLIGLAVDYAIQSHARFDEEQARSGGDSTRAARAAAAAGGPTIATAGLATAVGFLVLLLSPVPMVQDFGLLVVAGILIALACAFTAGLAALTRLTRREGPADLPPAFPRVRAGAREAADRLGDSPPARLFSRTARAVRLFSVERAERALAIAVAWPRRILLVALAVAVVGWAVDTQTEVVSDVRELVPSDLQALEDVETLEQQTGVAGEIDVTVRAEDITDPTVVQWMAEYQQETLKEAGYTEGDRCQQADDPPDLCPAFSLPTILNQVDTRDQEAVRGLLDAVPAYFAQGVVSEDRTTANLAFGIRLQSLSDQKRVIDRMKDGLDPPDGVTASVVGLPVLAAEANDALSSPLRRALTLVAALAAVFMVLLLLGRASGRRGRRGVREAAVPLIPIALATGWSAGILFVLGLLPEPLEVDLNPMSVTLGALVIAISTEFSVLLSARYRQEREAGAGPARAMEITYSSTGAAVLASGVTAIAGFAALIASDIQMLRDFGILTVVDLSVSLLGVMLVLPAALIWAEQRRGERSAPERSAARPYAPTPA